MIGVLGGMGPLATADFFAKVIAATPATRDEDHVPLLIQSDPRVPSRPAAILRGGESPLPQLLAGRDRLIAAGATALAMPCNTAHYWYPQLAEGCSVPFISILQACCNEAAARVAPGGQVGIIGTGATLSAGLFSTPLRQRGYVPIVPPDEELQEVVLPAIERVKAGFPAEAGAMLERSVQALIDRGAGAVILACTETPLALDAVGSPLRANCIDSTAALARACVAWWQTQRKA
jgi:aspartate racemase